MNANETPQAGSTAGTESAAAKKAAKKVSGTVCAKHPKGRSGKRFLTLFSPPDAKTDARPAAKSEPAGFGRLARTIRGRTTDLLAVSIVVIGGLTVGSQLSRWWDADDADVLPGRKAQTNVAWGAGGTPVTLQFGDRPYVIERQTLAGGREQAYSRLTEKCAGIAKRAGRPPGDFPQAERKLLAKLDQHKPVHEGAGTWQVFRVEGPLTLIVGTRYFGRPGAVDGVDGTGGISVRRSAPDTGSVRGTGSGVDKTAVRAPSVAWSGRRVVCWGFGFPAGEQDWTLYTFRPVEASAASLPGLPPIGLPEGCRRILSLQDASGGALLAFAGEGPAADWIRDFDRSFARRNWQATGDWRETPAGWSATFVPDAGDRPAGRVDVTFCRNGAAGLCGMISISPGVIE